MSSFDRIDPQTAREHLTQRYATGVNRGAWEEGLALEPVEALAQVCHAERGEPDTRGGNHWELPVARKVDIAAGLSLLDGIRDALDRQELLLISGARARGLTWEQIAEVLGLDSRQGAEQRARRLRDKWPHLAPSLLPEGACEDGEIYVPPPYYRSQAEPPDDAGEFKMRGPTAA